MKTWVKKKLIIQVKENQKGLLQNCHDIIRFSKPKGCHQIAEKGRNRIENRKTSVFNNDEQFIGDEQWCNHIKSIICVERQASIFNTKEKAYKERHEVAVYVSNYKLSAGQAHELVRKHWFIENKDHHVRDVTLKEDESRIRVNPENISALRSFALNILRKNKVGNIKGEIYENSLDYYNLYSYQHFI